MNDKFCSATGVFAPWKAELTNSEELTQVLLTRLEMDWLALPVKQRKAWSPKELEPRQSKGLSIWSLIKPMQSALNQAKML